MQTGIFRNETLPKNTVEFCVISDVHIANDEGNSSHVFTSQGRNDYVFANNKSRTPISGEAYTLKRFCEKVNFSGRLGHFDDGKHILVLLGDIINGECGYFASYNSVAYKMLSSSFMPWVHTGNIVYVAGNHDKNAKFYSTLTNFPRRFVYENEFTKCGIIFKHGHQFDFLCDGKSVFGMLGELASNVVVKLFPPNVEDLMRGRDFYYNHSSENKLRAPQSVKEMSRESRRVANGALDELEKRAFEGSVSQRRMSDQKFHTIICGHTHQSPVQIKTDCYGFSYFNTGKFAKDGCLNVVAKLKYPDFNVWELL